MLELPTVRLLVCRPDTQNSSFRIDAEQSVIMGLPPPEVDNWVSFRNYGLAHSIRDIYLKVST